MNVTTDASKIFSCEFFPPNTEAGMEKLLNTRKELDEHLDPAFYSVTFGAGGSNRDRTLETVDQLSESRVSVAPHISCVGSSREQIRTLLDHYIRRGVTRLVTLRGDIPDEGPGANDFKHANELVEFIREETGDHFHIEVAAYPEYHPESATPMADFEYFKRKIEAGADSAITQYFYNIDAYTNFMENCDKADLDVPVVPGIMPITNFKGLVRFSDNCGAEIPRWIRKQLEAYEDDNDSLVAFGVDVVASLCSRLLSSGAPGLHFYTLNQSQATLEIWRRLHS
ncbi:MAG: methylenetetrahydrofolate reductase [NAD(P)H] [Gammaproteobacteria bacterium]|jgi:methylenetetrahydrofolate reductase (NADPH)